MEFFYSETHAMIQRSTGSSPNRDRWPHELFDGIECKMHQNKFRHQNTHHHH